MDTFTWDKAVQAIAGYRACPEKPQLDSLCQVLSECTLYVPAGDFDGNNAVISPLISAQGGYFIPLYAARENVYPAQHSEGVRPADWKHILSQMPFVEGCVIEPYSVNFAFDRRFVDLLLDSSVSVAEPAVVESDVANPDLSVGDDAPVVVADVSDEVREEADVVDEVDEPSEDDVPAVQEEGETSEVPEASVPVVYAWPPVLESETDNVEAEDFEGNAEVAESDEVEDSSVGVEESEQYQVSIPDSIPEGLDKAVQAVSDELTVPAWLLEVRGVGDEHSYLMVVDTPTQWFEACGPDAVNRILSRFPDPGVSLDFAPRESDAGHYVEGKEPQYRPRVTFAMPGSVQAKDGQDKSFFRRLFKR